MDNEDFFCLPLEHIKLIYVFGAKWSKRIKSIRSPGILTPCYVIRNSSELFPRHPENIRVVVDCLVVVGFEHRFS
jgi:hypothetical protein